MSLNVIGVEESLLRAVITGTEMGLEMADIVPVPTGCARVATGAQKFAVIIGLVGKHSGTLTMSFSERGLLYVTSGMMGEEQTQLDEVALDCIMEVANIVGGQVKALLVGSDYNIEHISLPSLVFGGQYVYYSKGQETCAVSFELPNMPIQHFGDRFFTTQVSLLNAAGR